jgi:hypothetical protein
MEIKLRSKSWLMPPPIAPAPTDTVVVLKRYENTIYISDDKERAGISIDYAELAKAIQALQSSTDSVEVKVSTAFGISG